jgi:hypothetical protein
MPLFIEEMTKLVVQSEQTLDVYDSREAVASPVLLNIPEILHNLLMTRLDGLGSAKRTAQLGATIGREFAYLLIKTVSLLDEAILKDELRQCYAACGYPLLDRAIYRLSGELLRSSKGGAQEAEIGPEGCFHKALDIARRQQAKSLELRATLSLARLWQQQGKCEDARTLLSSTYHEFTEGFDTEDLQETKTLIEELRNDK